jgi:hypothetical protein
VGRCDAHPSYSQPKKVECVGNTASFFGLTGGKLMIFPQTIECHDFYGQ